MNFYAMQNNGGAAWSPILGEGNFHKASRFGRVTWADAAAAPPASAVASAAPGGSVRLAASVVPAPAKAPQPPPKAPAAPASAQAK